MLGCGCIRFDRLAGIISKQHLNCHQILIQILLNPNSCTEMCHATFPPLLLMNVVNTYLITLIQGDYTLTSKFRLQSCIVLFCTCY